MQNQWTLAQLGSYKGNNYKNPKIKNLKDKELKIKAKLRILREKDI